MSDQSLAVIQDAGLPVSLRDPQEILNEAHARATALKKMVRDTKSSVIIGKKEHLMFEAWATIANFYGCSVAASDALPVDLGGTHGFKAKARVVHDKTGATLSEAEAYCMRDEDNWHDKPTFQLASMAQTRAMAKAAASKFRWVVVMAGYAPTPAEEMTGEEKAHVQPYKPAPYIPAVRPQVGDRDFSASAGVVPTEPPASPPVQVADAPYTESAKAHVEAIAQRHTDEYETAEGMIGSHQPPFTGKSGKTGPGKLTLDLQDGGSMDFQYWTRPSGIGETGHSYCRIAFKTSEYNGKTQRTIVSLDWIEQPA